MQKLSAYQESSALSQRPATWTYLFAGQRPAKELTLVRWLLAVLIALAVVLPATASSKDFKVGIVDFALALDQTEKDGALKKLVDDAEDRKKTLEKKEKEILTLEQELKENGPMLSEDKAKELLASYQQKAVEYRKTVYTYEQEFAEKRNDVLGKIHQVMQQLAADIAKENDLDLMIEKNEGAVIYFQASSDYTPELIRRYEAAKKK